MSSDTFGLRASGPVTMLVVCAFILVGGRIVEAAHQEKASSVKLTTLAYECDDGTVFVAHYDLDSETDEMTLFLPDRTVRLPHVRSGS